MADGFSILSFLGSIKTAKDTLTLILDASKSLEKAELEYKIASLTKTLTELESQARDFEKLVQQKDLEIEKLKKLHHQEKSIQNEKLPDESIEILKRMSKVSEPVLLFHITQIMQIDRDKTKYFLYKLEERGFVEHSDLFYEQDETYSITDDGRKYLFETLKT